MKAIQHSIGARGALVFAFLVSWLMGGCGPLSGDGGANDTEISYLSVPVNPYENANTYFSTSRELRIDVFYETGAEPYINSSSIAGTPSTNLWTIAYENVTALFENRSLRPTVVIPRTLSQMYSLGTKNQANWTTDQVYNLGIQVRHALSNQTGTNIVILFLKGTYNGAATTLGVTIQGQTIIAVFKDAVRSGGSSQLSLQLLEQRTVIHEIGHVLGLIGLGISASSSRHEDQAHPRHCSDPECVMYYAGDARADLSQFIERVLTHGDHIMFDSQCLRATQTYVP